MKFSIITPEHNRQNLPYLKELKDSLYAQTYQDWEWIIYVNGDNISVAEVIDVIGGDDDRIKYYYGNHEPDNKIGEIKNRAFFKGTGEVLVEVDHDDWLEPKCLERLKEEFEKDPEVGFVYSEVALYNERPDPFIPYAKEHGWEHYIVKVKGKDCLVHKSFAPTAHSFAFIWYAPDHVRAWRRTVYEEIGGHSVHEWVCEDHQLMIMTYLKTKVVGIPEHLYNYRLTGDNTCYNHRNEEIQERTKGLFDFHCQDIAKRWADLEGLLKVEIGGGRWSGDGYINVDLDPCADIVHDLNEGLPFEDSSVGVVKGWHVLEHLPNKMKSMEEIHRVLVHGGWCILDMPSTDGRGAFSDPTHVSYWNLNSFDYYTNKEKAKYINNFDKKFQLYRGVNYSPCEGEVNMRVVLIAIKEDEPRWPGELNW